VQGRVLDEDGRPVAGAVVAVWETSPNGLYEQQDHDQPDYNLRGQLRTDEGVGLLEKRVGMHPA